ncbi:MAG: DUF3276 family protein [Alistipes sp.]|nr:DUF3276 family protein [Alistipes sp.]
MGLDIFESVESAEGYGDSLFSKMVKAGHRTYFIDVKTTRQRDYFLSLTELRKRITPNGIVNERNKVFVYQEDFDKLGEALKEALDFINSNKETKSEE